MMKVKAIFDQINRNIQDLVDFFQAGYGLTNRGYGFLEGIIYALGAGAGFTLAMVLLAGLREESELSDIPALIRGTAMNLIIAGVLSMAFMGFAGLFSST